MYSKIKPHVSAPQREREDEYDSHTKPSRFVIYQMNYTYSVYSYVSYQAQHLKTEFDVFLTVHHSTDSFHLPTLMHNSFIH